MVPAQVPAHDQLKQMPAPALPWFDWGACPFETCTYSQWTVREAVTVYDTWKPDRHEIAQLPAGEKAAGVTGVVITYTPGKVRMDRDLPAQNLRQGDTILVYTRRGEGFWAVWFKGTFQGEFDLTFAKLLDGTGCGGAPCAATFVTAGKNAWWAQVKLRSGQVGWVDMDHGLLGGFDF
jgi:hypothetical protein